MTSNTIKIIAYIALVVLVFIFIIKLQTDVDLFELMEIFDVGFRLTVKDNIVFGLCILTKKTVLRHCKRPITRYALSSILFLSFS